MVTIRRVESLLAYVAALTVAGTIGVAVWVQVVVPPPTGAVDPAGAPWQVVRGEHATYSVPPEADGWTVRRPREVIYYDDADGDPLVGVGDVAAYDDGYCPGARGLSNRGFVGFAVEQGRPGLRAVNRRLARLFVLGIGGSAGRGPPTSDEVLRDGTPSVRSRVTIALPDPAPCQPARVGLDVVTFAGGHRTVSLVLVRDLAEHQAPNATAEAILGSVRPATTP
ncbi:MAG: hypothetical protein WKF79_04260 [Nocardioides sp.]